MATDSTARSGVQTLFHVNIRVKPSDVDEFLKSLTGIHPSVTSEPECLFTDLHQSPDDPGLFRITEVWAGSIEWCKNVQLPKAYYKPYEQATKHLWVVPRTIEFWETVPGWQTHKSEFLG